METTIIVAERKEKAGTGKNGKPYTLTTLISSEGSKFSGFRIDKGIGPGCEVRLYAKESKFKNNYDIERIIEYDADPKPETKQGQGKPSTVLPPVPPLPAPERLNPGQQTAWIRRARDVLDSALGTDWDPMVYEALLAELVREYHSEYMSERIGAEQRARWGK